jgi:hypothetical protein
LKVSRPELKVRFHVQSAAPLRRVALVVRPERGKAVVKLFAVDGANAAPGPAAFNAATELRLARGLTTLIVEAENEGGTGQTLPLVVNYVPPPVRVALEALEPREGGPTLSFREGPDGKLSSPASPRARLRLHGKVVWDQADAQQLQHKHYLAVYVNGSQQWRAELDPPRPGARERTFTAEILLNRPRDNRLEVELPGLTLDENSVRTATVDCLQPLLDQWLHVQIISPDEPDERKLNEQVLQTLQATNYVPAKEEFTRPPFAGGRLYPPMTEDVDHDQVVGRLLKIKRQIRQRALDGWPNDVVVLYYVGGEAVDSQGRFASLTQGSPPRPLISRAQLEKEFADMLGVKVLLLDVARGQGGQGIAVSDVRQEVQRWLDPPSRHAWMRAAWLGAGLAPPQARLLAALHEALLQAHSLGEVAQHVDRRFRILSRQLVTLQADWYLPPEYGSQVMTEKR